MCDILCLGMLIFGIITLITGKFTVTRNKTVYGAPARIVGAIMLLPLPILIVVGISLGVGIAAGGGNFNLQDHQRLTTILMIIGASVVAGCFVLAMVVAFLNAEPTRTLRPRRRDDDYDDDRPRRRRRDIDDDDDDRPRRPPRADDRYEDDEPRPRRRPPEDDDDRPRRREPDDRIR